MKSGDGSRDIVNNSAVPRRSSGKDEAALADWRAEHLAVPGTGHLRVAVITGDDSLSTQLARRVAADPGDARLHVARVNHHVLAEDGDEVFAALVDAFLAFGASGTGLRQRLLEGGRRLIGELTIGLSGELTEDADFAALLMASPPTDPGCPSGIVDAVGLQ